MRKITYEYVILFIQMIVIGFFLIILSNYYFVSQAKDFLGNDIFSNNVMGVSISYAEKGQQKTDYQIPYNAFEGNYMIYKHISSDNHIKRGVYGTNDVFDFSAYIQQGRFFSKDDFQNNKPTAVIGMDVLPETIMKSGVRYYGVNDSLYEVIGIFKKTGEELDNAAFLNLNYLLQHDSAIGLYYIDAKEISSVNKIVAKIENNIPLKLIAAKIEHEKIKEELLPEFKIMYFLAIMASVCNLIITSHFFVVRQEYKTAVKKLCGLTNVRMLFEYGRLIGILTLIAFAVTGAAIILLHNITMFKLNQLSFTNYLLVLFLLILAGAVIIYQIVWNSMKVDISSTLKG